MIALLLIAGLAWAQDCAPDEDCDGDGWTSQQGDCDESNAQVHPGLDEVCSNRIDDNCDRLFDEGCDRSAQQGQLWGGGACRGSEEGGSIPLDALILLPFFWIRRKP